MDDQQLRRILFGDEPKSLFGPQKRTEGGETHPVPTREQLEQTLRRLAHEVYEQRGASHGDNFDEWLAAEAEITARIRPDVVQSFFTRE